MSNYIRGPRRKSAKTIWSILCDHAKDGVTLAEIATAYQDRTGDRMPDSNICSVMQANQFYIFSDHGRYYPYRDEVTGVEFDHAVIGNKIVLVDYA